MVCGKRSGQRKPASEATSKAELQAAESRLRADISELRADNRELKADYRALNQKLDRVLESLLQP